MKSPKIVVIGAGSYFFGKPIIHKMATSAALAGGTLALVDLDSHVLGTMARLARRVFRQTRCGVKVMASTDRRAVLRDADFVVLTFSRCNAHYRGIDTEIAARHGIRMCSSDTIGPGGIFRALRELPEALAVCRDVERLCPAAWVINFINPTAVIGIGLRRYAPKIKSFALCDGHHEPGHTQHWLKITGLLPEQATHVPPELYGRFRLDIAGVNHFTWVLGCEHNGRDLMPMARKWVLKQAREERRRERADITGSNSKGAHNFAYMLQLFDLFGVIPDTISHTKEYVPFYQGYGVRPVEPEPLRLFDACHRAQLMAEDWRKTEDYAAGRRSARTFLKEIGNDHASDIIESMWGGLGQPFFVNTWNQGAVPNLPADAFLELRCDLDLRGPRPQPVRPMPRGVLGLQQLVLDTHELTAQAAVTCDRRILRRALLTDPLGNNLGDADACLAELLAAEREALPTGWFRR